MSNKTKQNRGAKSQGINHEAVTNGNDCMLASRFLLSYNLSSIPGIWQLKIHAWKPGALRVRPTYHMQRRQEFIFLFIINHDPFSSS